MPGLQGPQPVNAGGPHLKHALAAAGGRQAVAAAGIQPVEVEVVHCRVPLRGTAHRAGGARVEEGRPQQRAQGVHVARRDLHCECKLLVAPERTPGRVNAASGGTEKQLCVRLRLLWRAGEENVNLALCNSVSSVAGLRRGWVPSCKAVTSSPLRLGSWQWQSDPRRSAL